MAVQVFKDGESTFVDPLRLKYFIDGGYTLTNEPEVKEEIKEEMSDYEREMRDEIKTLGGKIGGRASIEKIEEKLKELKGE